MNQRRWMHGLWLAGLVLALAGCDVISGPGTLTGRVTYAKDPAGSLTDPGNAGAPAAGVKVLIYGLEKQNIPSGGAGVFIENLAPTKEVITDAQGRYTVELPSGNYVVRLAPAPKLYHCLADVGPARTTTLDFIILPPAGVIPTPGPSPVPPPVTPPQPYPTP